MYLFLNSENTALLMKLKNQKTNWIPIPQKRVAKRMLRKRLYVKQTNPILYILYI